MIEGIFRSVNNMLEHFHQSFFLYVLPNTHRYISIGMYMPPLGCLIVPLIVSLLSLWIQIFHLDQEEGEPEKKYVVRNLFIQMILFVRVKLSNQKCSS